MRFVAALALVLAALPVHATLIECQNVYITEVVVEGARDDGFVLQNKLVIKTSSACGGKALLHLSITDPAFDALLSIALVAKTTGSKVHVAVNTSEQTTQSNKIAYILIVE